MSKVASASVRGGTAVSILGMGAIGSAVGTVFVRSGHPTTIWNRTVGKGDEIVAAGAIRSGDATEALAASPLVILCLSSYAAVTEVLESSKTVLAGRVLVNLATGRPDEAEILAAWLHDQGATYLDGVIQAAPAQVGTREAAFLFSGSTEAFEAYRTRLELLGRVSFLGSRPAAANLYYLALLGLWYETQLAYLEALRLVGSAGVAPAAFAPLAAAQLEHVVRAAESTAREVADSDFPRGPASLREHAPVLDDLIQVRRGANMDVGNLQRIAEAVRRRIDAGHGGDGFNSVAHAAAVGLTW